MAMSKVAVEKNANAITQENEAKVKAFFAEYESKIDRRLVKGDRTMVFQLDSRLQLEAMRKLVGNYRKGGWHVDVSRKGDGFNRPDVVALGGTGNWVFTFE